MKHFLLGIGVCWICMLAACGGGNGGSAEGLVSTDTDAIAVLESQKSRKAKLGFDLVEARRQGGKLDLVLYISNRGKAAKVHYEKEELAITDSNGYIYKVATASIDGKPQFGDNTMVDIPDGSKLKSVISFSELRDDTEAGKLFFQGKVQREEKEQPFRITFKNIALK